jgi:glutamate carboxypeptidase
MTAIRRGISVALITLVGSIVASACTEPAQEQTQPDVQPTLSDVERELRQIVQANNADAVEFLERVVNINSGTLNSDGVREVGAVFSEALNGIGLTTDWIGFPPEIERGGHLFATHEGTRGKKLLMIGHLDTVFEKDSPFQTASIEGDTLFGPGASDMKGGDVVIVYALKALQQAGLLDDMTVTVAMIGDEERPGGEISIVRGDLIAAAERSDVALGFEGCVGINNVTVARRGSSNWMLTTTGKAGHSGQIFSDTYGSGAIFEAARILNAFRQEVLGPEYLTFNPGIILGGTNVNYDRATASGDVYGKTNVIPSAVTVHGGLRFIAEEQKEQARERMREIVAQNLPHTTAEISFNDGYPAMSPEPANDSLMVIYDEISRALGYGPIEPLDPGARGAADISFVADGMEALSGLGPHGRGAHSEDDQLFLTSLPIATARAAILMYRLTR